MPIPLLVLCAEELSQTVASAFAKLDFTLSFGRGCLKVKQVLDQEKPGAVLWFTPGFDQGLSSDLSDLLNQSGDTPVILVQDDGSENLPGIHINKLFERLDISDRPDEIINHVLRACGQQLVSNNPLQNQTFEMDFKNAVNQFIQNPADEEEKTGQPSLNLLTPWVAVDSDEKKIIADSGEPKKQILSKMKNWLNKGTS